MTLTTTTAETTAATLPTTLTRIPSRRVKVMDSSRGKNQVNGLYNDLVLMCQNVMTKFNYLMK